MSKIPTRYDTENFFFEYDLQSDTLSIKIKNEDVESSKDEAGIYLIYSNSHYGAIAIDIRNMFKHQDIPLQSHIQTIDAFFMPWFKLNKDVRYELNRGIERFAALHAHDALRYGPDQYAMLKEKESEVLEEISTRLPEKQKEREELKARLISNCQDHGVSGADGTSFFKPINDFWILEETDLQREDKPEYLWCVKRIETNSVVVEFTGYNAQALDYIMEQQKKIYGINILDLDKIDRQLQDVSRAIYQIELILDIPESQSLLNTPESNL